MMETKGQIIEYTIRVIDNIPHVSAPPELKAKKLQNMKCYRAGTHVLYDAGLWDKRVKRSKYCVCLNCGGSEALHLEGDKWVIRLEKKWNGQAGRNN